YRRRRRPATQACGRGACPCLNNRFQCACRMSLEHLARAARRPRPLGMGGGLVAVDADDGDATGFVLACQSGESGANMLDIGTAIANGGGRRLLVRANSSARGFGQKRCWAATWTSCPPVADELEHVHRDANAVGVPAQ